MTYHMYSEELQNTGPLRPNSLKLSGQVIKLRRHLVVSSIILSRLSPSLSAREKIMHATGHERFTFHITPVERDLQLAGVKQRINSMLQLHFYCKVLKAP